MANSIRAGQLSDSYFTNLQEDLDKKRDDNNSAKFEYKRFGNLKKETLAQIQQLEYSKEQELRKNEEV